MKTAINTSLSGGSAAKKLTLAPTSASASMAVPTYQAVEVRIFLLRSKKGDCSR